MVRIQDTGFRIQFEVAGLSVIASRLTVGLQMLNPESCILNLPEGLIKLINERLEDNRADAYLRRHLVGAVTVTRLPHLF